MAQQHMQFIFENAPYHDILQGGGFLEQRALQTILPENGYLEDTIIFIMLMHYAKQALPHFKVAILHPEFVARFFVSSRDGAYEGMELLNNSTEQNKAYNYLYGIIQDFDMLLIPIHKRARMETSEHWMLGIYDSSGSGGQSLLLVCDPVDNPLPINDNLRNILRLVLNTATPGQKHKGTICKPKHVYNHQDDAFSCGVFVIFYARQYLENRRIFFDTTFQIAAERQSIYNFFNEEFVRQYETNLQANPIQSDVNLCPLTLGDLQSPSIRPTRACKTKSETRMYDIIMDLYSSKTEERAYYMHRRRENETVEERNVRLERDSQQTSNRISNETYEQRNHRLEEVRYRSRNQRANEDKTKRAQRLEEQRRRSARSSNRRSNNHLPTYKEATSANVEYFKLGPFSIACIHDGALHFPEERVRNNTDVNSFGDCCLHGRISQPEIKIPNELALLFTRLHPLSKDFHKRIRTINACFALASFNIADDRTFNNRGIYSFTAGGQIYHKINLAAQPTQDAQGSYETPRYGQMYFLDQDEAVNERINEPMNSGLNRELVQVLEKIMRSQNPFVQGYMMMKEIVDENNTRAMDASVPLPQVHMAFTSRAGDDPRRFNAPTYNEVAAVLTLNADQSISENEMVIRERGKNIVTMKNTDSRIEPFTYPLFYPQGNFGFDVNMPLQTPYPSRNHLTRTELAQYRLAFRKNLLTPLQQDPTIAALDLRAVNFNALHFGGRLYQQYVVDTYIRVERDRILWIKLNQNKLLADQYSRTTSFLNKLSDEKNATVGEKLILPSSFPGSTRYYAEHFEDAMAIVRRYGSPDFFITVTSNPDWPELKEAARIELDYNTIIQQTAQDRPDLVARIAKLKFDQIVDDIMKKQIFGVATAYVYTIEFQKRGLPHMHLLVVMSADDKIHAPDQIDAIISAEIPENDPDLRQLVIKHMVHNPCENLNMNAPCMVTKNGKTKCRFHYPMEFQEHTSLMDDEKPKYRRRYRDNLDSFNPDFSHEDAVYRKDSHGQRVTRDNRHVAPYNGYLLKKYSCHINVEFVGSIKAVKYLYKYIYKGHDCARIKITENGQQIMYNEPETFVEARYVSPPEACWRLFGNEIQKKSHSVQRLDIHLPLQYRPINIDQAAEDFADIGLKGSTLEAYFRHNTEFKAKENNGEQVIYTYYWQMPENYRWIGKTSEWKLRQRSVQCIGRVHIVSLVAQPELYHLRTLLFHVNNATSFADLLVVNGITHATYKQACLARGLTYDDQQYIDGLCESALSKMPEVMRNLFIQILILGSPDNPKRLWDMFKEDLAEDFIREARHNNSSVEEAINKAYRIISYKLNTEATEGRNFQFWVQRFGMDNVDTFEDIMNPHNINSDESITEGLRLYKLLNYEQRKIVDTILEALENPLPVSKCFFVDGPGGTGKTFTYITLYHIIRGRRRIVKCMAFTGIAAINLPEGRTSHKIFGLKVPLTSYSVSTIKPGSAKSHELSETDVFILDEAPMLPKYGLQNIDQLLRQIEKNSIPFGGKVMVLGGDFRQCTPVQAQANQSEIIDLSIRNSYLWQHFTNFSLSKNMRVDPEEEEFEKYLLDLGDGVLPTNELGEIEVPDDMRSNGNLVEEAFGTFLANGNYEAMKKRVILAPLNKDVNKINEEVVALLPGEEKIFKSFDSVKDQQEGGLQFTPEFLNSVDIADLPPHELKLKVNTIIMLLRNLDVSEGLCNGTRLIVTELCNNIIKAKIITGEYSGREVHIPRITLDSNKSQLGCTMQRLQFPVRTAFAMTIHKSQGQTLDFVGVLLLNAVFMHGMLYVAFSRVKRRTGLKVILPRENPCHTRNVVWKDILLKTTSETPFKPQAYTDKLDLDDFNMD